MLPEYSHHISISKRLETISMFPLLAILIWVSIMLVLERTGRGIPWINPVTRKS